MDLRGPKEPCIILGWGARILIVRGASERDILEHAQQSVNQYTQNDSQGASRGNVACLPPLATYLTAYSFESSSQADGRNVELLCVKSRAAREVDAAEKKKTVELFKNADLSQYAIRGSEDDWKSALATGPQGIISVKRSATLTAYLLVVILT